MTRASEGAGLSDLEDELELEFEDVSGGQADEFEIDEELDDQELESDFESGEDEFESQSDDYEFEVDSGTSYASRLQELSEQEFESEFELDARLGEIFDDMQTEYFLGGLKKLARRGLRAGARALISRVKKAAAGLPIGQALKGILASRSLTDLLKNVAKSGLSVAMRSHPGLAALSSIGGSLLKQGEFRAGDRQRFEDVVALSREAFGHLARNLNEQSNSPIGGAQQAIESLRAAASRVQAGRGGAASPRGRKGARVIRLRPGQKLLIIG
jgi:hypothetical protein